jgi:hypothetical protein
MASAHSGLEEKTGEVRKIRSSGVRGIYITEPHTDTCTAGETPARHPM